MTKKTVLEFTESKEAAIESDHLTDYYCDLWVWHVHVPPSGMGSVTLLSYENTVHKPLGLRKISEKEYAVWKESVPHFSDDGTEKAEENGRNERRTRLAYSMDRGAVPRGAKMVHSKLGFVAAKVDPPFEGRDEVVFKITSERVGYLEDMKRFLPWY